MVFRPRKEAHVDKASREQIMKKETETYKYLYPNEKGIFSAILKISYYNLERESSSERTRSILENLARNLEGNS